MSIGWPFTMTARGGAFGFGERDGAIELRQRIMPQFHPRGPVRRVVRKVCARYRGDLEHIGVVGRGGDLFVQRGFSLCYVDALPMLADGDHQADRVLQGGVCRSVHGHAGGRHREDQRGKHKRAKDSSAAPCWKILPQVCAGQCGATGAGSAANCSAWRRQANQADSGFLGFPVRATDTVVENAIPMISGTQIGRAPRPAPAAPQPDDHQRTTTAETSTSGIPPTISDEAEPASKTSPVDPQYEMPIVFLIHSLKLRASGKSGDRACRRTEARLRLLRGARRRGAFRRSS